MKIKQKPSKKNFNNNDIDQKKTLIESEKILLNLEILNIQKDKSYEIRIIDLSNNKHLKTNKKISEIINNYIIESIYEFIFGKEQKLLIEMIIKERDKQTIYNVEVSVGQLIGNNRIDNNKNNQIFNFEGLKEELSIKAEQMKNGEEFLIIHFILKISSNNNVKPTKEEIVKYFIEEKYKFYFTVENNCGEPIYESEAFTDNGKFNIIQIPKKHLNSKFYISFHSKKNNFGKISTNLKDFTEKIGNLIFIQRLSINHYMKILNYSMIREEVTFLDYINEKIRIGLCIGIDFTQSNKNPDDPSSLHYITNIKKNPYERAILSCGKVLAYYDYDQLFPVFGFGAIVNNKNSSCFSINFNEDPNIELIDNIIECYHKCLRTIKFAGPTNFAPIIERIIKDIKEQNDPKEYQVLMILTDGIIQDMNKTIDALVEGSFYPLSVIIIGIGNTDFSQMEKLDGDDIPLISRQGIKRQRDLVQFVPFSKFEGDEEKLAYEVLEEIPRQIIEYYTLNFIYPEMLQEEEGKKNILRDTLNLEILKKNYSSEIRNAKVDDLFPNTSIRLFDDNIKITQSYNRKKDNKNNYSQINEFFKIIVKLKKTNLIMSTNTF